MLSALTYQETIKHTTSRVADLFTAFPKIEQFRHVVSHVNKTAHFLEQSLPEVVFTGTVKLHGTNAGVQYRPKQPLMAQSRKKTLTLERDNDRFAAFVLSKQDVLKQLIEDLIADLKIDLQSDEYIVVYGEWCGKGIQKKVAICALPKMFVVFNVCLVKTLKEIGPDRSLHQRKWIESKNIEGFHSADDRIFNIYQFPTFTIKIDFSDPKSSQNELIDLTNIVEAECPVGKHFGVSGVGEGIVWTGNFDSEQLVFKVKGEKHAVTKVKKLAAVDIEKLKSVNEFVAYAVTNARLEQGWGEMSDHSMKNVKHFINWIKTDVIKEEGDTLAENGLTMKDVVQRMSTECVKWYRANLNV